MGSIADNIARVRERIGIAAERAGRRADEITLVAVTKKQSVEAVQEALRAGLADIGENYVQEAMPKRAGAEGLQAQWHLIGHLQRKKATQAVHTFDVIQSVDSLKLAQALSGQADAQGKTLQILLQVHLGDEETKFGVAPETAQDLAAEIGVLRGLDLQGFMGIAPFGVDPRPHFAALRRLFEALPTAHRRTLSMGMTGDFEMAITEGATMVRIGTAIFGPRQ